MTTTHPYLRHPLPQLQSIDKHKMFDGHAFARMILETDSCGAHEFMRKLRIELDRASREAEQAERSNHPAAIHGAKSG